MATSTLGNGTLVLAGTTSGTTTVTATAVAGTTTLTLPAATDTLVGKATTDTLTNKTLTGAVMNGTLGATTPSTVAATTLTTSSTVTHNGGTANGVGYLDGSKVLTTGSALVFDGTNLGIGTSSPAAKLQTQQTSAGSRVTGALLQNVGNTTNTAVSLDFAPHENTTAPEVLARINAVRNNPSNAPTDLVFSTNNATLQERARIDSSGNLLVGLTSALGSQLGVQAAGGNGTSFTLRHTSATAGKYRLAGVDSSNNYLIYNNSNVGMYMTDGGTSWTATSDETQKILTSEFSNAAIFISTVRATRGRYKTDDESTSRSFLIAQDWQDYLPEAISEKDGILGLSYQETIPVLVKAIQELTARITALESA